MIIRILTSKKKTSEYDLTLQSKVSSLSAYITKAAGRHQLAALVAIQQQLVSYYQTNPAQYTADQTAQWIYGTVTAHINKITATVPIVIKSQASQYNINVFTERKNLEKRITDYAKDNKLAVLKNIQNQLAIAKQTYPAFPELNPLIALTSERITLLEKPNIYQSYTAVLQAEFLQPTQRNHSLFFRNTPNNNTVILKYDAATLQKYLQKPVTLKQKTGEDNYRELSAAFFFDYVLYFSKITDQPSLLVYLIVVTQFFAHNSSYYPAQGHGKSQLIECQTPLYYYRSQEDHNLMTQYREGQPHSYGLQNAPFKQMITAFLDKNPSRTAQMNGINTAGVVTVAMTSNNFGPFLAHAGTRANNVALKESYLTNQFSKENPTVAISRILQQPVIPAVVNQEELNTQVKTYFNGFKTLLNKTVHWQPSTKIMSKVCAERNHLAQHIVNGAQNLTHLRVVHPNESSFILVDIYPSMVRNRDIDNYKQGLTNVVIGFLGGLINYHLTLQGLHSFVQRRQSFGFLQTTITNTQSLQIRLSLGLEVGTVAEVIISALSELNFILSYFNFMQPELSQSQVALQLINKAMSPCERARGNTPSEKTGNYLLNAMRVEDDQWIALCVSQKYLELHAKQLGADLTKEYLCAAFTQYIQDFIINRVENKMVALADHQQIPRQGYHFPKLFSVAIRKPWTKTSPEIIQQHVILQLLQKIVRQLVSQVASMSTISSINTSVVLLGRLLHKSQKAIALLEHAAEYELTHIYAKANELIEQLLEYQIIFNNLLNPIKNSAALLTETETQYFNQQLNCSSQLFYFDSGEQAIVAGLIAMIQQLNMDEPQQPISLYFSTNSYYEIPGFFQEAAVSINTICNVAPIWFYDITQLKELEANLLTPGSLKALVIDITNNSSGDSLAKLAPLIQNLSNKGIWVQLACSSLKHEELGLDKYQTGRMVMIMPPGKKLNDTIENKLKDISQVAMNAVIASFRLTVNAIIEELPPTPLTVTNPEIKAEIIVNSPAALMGQFGHLAIKPEMKPTAATEIPIKMEFKN